MPGKRNNTRRLTVEEFNCLYPVGTPCTYTNHPGANPEVTKTRSEAWELGHGAMVVLIEGRTGVVSTEEQFFKIGGSDAR